MYGMHEAMAFKNAVFALVLEVLFLGICTVLVGCGLSELRKGHSRRLNIPLVILGFVLAGASLYMTTLLVKG
jgi:hypothetical protein